MSSLVPNNAAPTSTTAWTSRLDQLLARTVDAGQVPFVAAVVADRDSVLYEGAAGHHTGCAGPVAVSPRTPFQIKSMTKVVTCVAALQLVERGELDLEAPVEEFLPEFADLRVLDGIDADSPRLRVPSSRATVRQLMTSTVGLGYWLWNRTLLRYEEITGLPNLGASRDDLAAFQAPLLADPGTRWEYGIGYDWLGRVVEVVAGTPLATVFHDSITAPLGMTGTAFVLPPSAQQAEPELHVPGDTGWDAIGHALVDRAWHSGGDGLHSTPLDYLRLQRMLLRQGELDGTHIIRPDTVDAIFSPQIGDLALPEELPAAVPDLTDRVPLGPGWSWGYGLLVATADRPGGRRAGSGGWSGLFNTHFWVDHAAGLCAGIYISTLPFMDRRCAAPLMGEFENAVYSLPR